MSLDGLRAWIGLVERKLTMRTRVFLVLVAIAIGGAAAGIYLGANARTDKVSEGELQSVQDELSTRIDALESRLETQETSGATLPEAEVEATPEAKPRTEAEPSPEEKGGSAESGGVEPEPKPK